MQFDTVLFDLDGTLVASAPGIFSSVQYTLEHMGHTPVEASHLSKFIGPPLYDSFQRYSGLDTEQAEKAVSIYRAHYTENGLLNATVFCGIPNLLRRLKERGVYVALASAKPASSAQRMLEHFGLSRFFDRIIGAEPGRRESDKTSLLHSALPARYKRAVMIGDRSFDMEAAKSVGIEAIGAGWGYGTEEELRFSGADQVARTVYDAEVMLLGDASTQPKGFFISIEGMDKSGKTTQMNAVADHIRAFGYDVVTTREPGGTQISEEIREIVLSPEKTMYAETEALLYAAARAQHVRETILPALAQGKVVLCDRFVDSSIVYQGAGRELGMDQVTKINAFAIKGTLPDLTLLFVVDAQTAFLRRSSATNLDRLERAGEAFFQRVYEAYGKIAKVYADRVKCVDAMRTIEAVTEDACAQIDRLLVSR